MTPLKLSTQPGLEGGVYHMPTLVMRNTILNILQTLADSSLTDVKGTVKAVEPYIIFGITWFLSSIGGLAALLRTNQGAKITGKMILSAFVNSGFCGLVTLWLLWDSMYDDHFYRMLAISCMSGFGGMTIVDLVAQSSKGTVRRILLQVLQAGGEKEEKKTETNIKDEK